MLQGAVGPMDALYISISSMLVVFTVLLVLFLVTGLFPLIFKDRKKPEAQKPPEGEDDRELLAVLTAAVQAHLAQKKENPCVRSAPRRATASLTAENPLARDCRIKKE